ncbi:MAG: ABC transporter ATP-binding protein [Clostridium sp.]|nr:ABC transporter ATP-binding protein [Clostridium sp.]
MILEIKNLSKSFGKASSKSLILKDINFSVNKGEFLCIVGPSGCGKSTLLRQIGSFDAADSGHILLNNKWVTKPELNRIMVFQDFNQLFPWKTVMENIIFPLKTNNLIKNKKELLEIGEKYLSMVKLEKFSKYYPHELSGGMKQRIAIARALAINPHILLMDEPFGSLDAQTRSELQDMLLNIWQETNITVIFVTHDIQESILLSDRIVIMGKNPGHIKKIIDNPLPRPRSIENRELSSIYKNIYNEL